MLSQTAFEEYFKSKLSSEIAQFEQYRKSQLLDYRIWQITRLTSLTIFGIISLLFFAHLFHHELLSKILINKLIGNDIRILLTFIIIVVLIAVFAKERMRKLTENFSYSSKYSLFGKIIAAYEGFKYYPLSGIDLEVINSSNLFKNYNEYKSEDYIQGIYKNVDIQLSKIDLSNISYTEVFQNGKYEVIKNEKSIFNGLFIICSINKKFSSTTYVLPDAWIKLLNSLPSYFARVILEDPEFEKIFDVYGNNQIEARYLLTPSFIERLKTIAREYSIRCVFRDQKLYLAVELDHEFLPSLKLTEEITKARIKQIYIQLNLIFKIIEDLKLNMNIGL